MNAEYQKLIDDANEVGGEFLQIQKDYHSKLKSFFERHPLKSLGIMDTFKWLRITKDMTYEEKEPGQLIARDLFDEAYKREYMVENLERTIRVLEQYFKPVDKLKKSLEAFDSLLANTPKEELDEIYQQVTEGKVFEGPTVDEYFGGLGMSDEQRELLMNDATILGGHRTSDKPRRIFKINVGEITP